MIWAAPIIICVLMLILFFGVTIAGGRAHDRQNIENALKKERSDVRVWDEAADDPGAPHIQRDPPG